MNAEKWLNENVDEKDWNHLEECLPDTLWTSNVIKYMESYLKYKLQEQNNYGTT